MDNNLQSNENRDWANMMPDYNTFDVKQMRVGFGRRLGSSLIDLLIFLIILLVVIMVSGVMSNIDFSSVMSNPMGFSEDMEAISPTLAIITSILGFLYFLPEAFLGQTLGKMILSIKIADMNRKPATTNQLLIRYFIKHGDYIFSLIGALAMLNIVETIGSIYGFVIWIGFFFVLGANRMAFHDMGANTAVFFKDEIDYSTQNIQ